ncbi:hypothetical protein ACI78V_02000 [Geodermatophilus sp. SYSU D00742]
MPRVATNRTRRRPRALRSPVAGARADPEGKPPPKPLWKRTGVVVGGGATVVGLVSGALAIEGWIGERLAPPLTVSAQHLTTGPCAPGWVVPQPPEALGEVPPAYDPAEPDARLRWIEEHGGVDAGVTTAEVTVQGTSGTAVILTGLRVDVVRREEPLQGTNVAEVCGDAFHARYFSVDLDDEPPDVAPSEDRRAEVEQGQSPPDPVDFPYTVTESDPELFSIVAWTEACYCEWTATLEWRVGDEEGETTITDDGDPFRVSATTNAPWYGNYDGGPLQPSG